MAMERVTIEQNGEQFVLEVPEGTTDQQIQAFVAQQQGGAAPAPQPLAMTQAPPDINTNLTAQAGIAAARPVGSIAATQAMDLVKLGQIAGQITPRIAGEFLGSPIKSVKDLASAYVAGHPMAGQALNTPLKAVPGALMRGLGGAIAAPESAFLMPYNMAAYEQAKIRQNPNAPGLEFNPYAQTVRGEAATQARAGAANQMRTVANMPYGNVTPEERAMLDEDARIRSTIRKKALEKVMGPVAPGSF
jgi:hypothetical protein